MSRTVGSQGRSPYILDPQEAHRAGRILDAMLRAAQVPGPHGVWRATHQRFNEMDDQRRLSAALRVATAPAHG
jgi:hypothetical protein